MDRRQMLADVLLNGQQQPAQQNAPYVAGQGPYNTQLSPLDELAFRQWTKDNRVPFNPDAGATDYDMRGFYRGMQQQHPRAAAAIDPNDNQMHYPDYWKTPLHQTFSNESQWATPVAPTWNQRDQLVSPGGRILFDDRPRGGSIGKPGAD